MIGILGFACSIARRVTIRRKGRFWLQLNAKKGGEKRKEKKKKDSPAFSEANSGFISWRYCSEVIYSYEGGVLWGKAHLLSKDSCLLLKLWSMSRALHSEYKQNGIDHVTSQSCDS